MGMSPACTSSNAIADIPRRPKAIRAGVVVAAVPHSHVVQLAGDGERIARLVTHRVSGAFELLVFIKHHTDPMTIALHRGGHRRWHKLELVEKFVRLTFPKFPSERMDVFLQAAVKAPPSH